MAHKSIAERIAQLDAQKKALQARMGKQERANDTRRKVLLGAFVLHRIENDRDFGGTLHDFVKRELVTFLSRESDKALFADLLASTPAGKSSDAAEVPPFPVASSEASKTPGADLDKQPISATAQKPAQQIGKTMAEVMRYSEDA